MGEKKGKNKKELGGRKRGRIRRNMGEKTGGKGGG